MTRKGIIRKLDTIFSEQIRSIGRCQKCGGTSNLQCAHVYSRRHKWLRWEKENAFALCAGCHLWWHHEPAEAIRWAMTKKDFKKLDKLRLINKPIKESDLVNILEKLLQFKEELVF